MHVIEQLSDTIKCGLIYFSMVSSVQMWYIEIKTTELFNNTRRVISFLRHATVNVPSDPFSYKYLV